MFGKKLYTTLKKEIFKFVQTFPNSEQYGLISQLNRSTNSVCANLAESHGRFHYADKVRVLYIVRGEIEEIQSHIIVAVSRGYIKKETGVVPIDKYEKLKMKINCYISFLMKSKKYKENT